MIVPYAGDGHSCGENHLELTDEEDEQIRVAMGFDVTPYSME
jgi:hypothetical protein